MNRIEALADALSSKTAYADPQSEEYQCRNPLSLKAFLPQQERTDTGLRKFHNIEAGIKACLYDLKIKCSGISVANIKADSPIRRLIRCYSMPDHITSDVVEYLRKALDDDSITSDTPIAYFVEGKPNGK